MDNTTNTSQNGEELLIELLSNIKSSLRKIENKNLYNYFYLDCIAQNQNSLEFPTELNELEREVISKFEILGSLHLNEIELLEIDNDSLFIQKIRQRDTINQLIIYLLKDIESSIILEQRLLKVLQKLNSTSSIQAEIFDFFKLKNISADKLTNYIEYTKIEIEQLIYILKFEENPSQTFYYYITELNKIAYKLFTQKEGRYKYIYNFISSIAYQQDLDGFNSIQDQISLVDSKYFTKQEIENKITNVQLPDDNTKINLQKIFDKYLKLLSADKFRDLLFLIGSFDSKELVDLTNLVTLIKGIDKQILNYNRQYIDVSSISPLLLSELQSITNTQQDITQKYQKFFSILDLISKEVHIELRNLTVGVSQIMSLLLLNFDIEFVEEGSEGRFLLDLINELKSGQLLFLLEEAYAGNFDESITAKDNININELTNKIFTRIENKRLSKLDNLEILNNLEANEFQKLFAIRLKKLLRIALRQGQPFIRVEKDFQGVISRIFFEYQQINPRGLTEEMAEIFIYINEQTPENILKQLYLIFDFCITNYQMVIKEIGSRVNSNRFSWIGVIGIENDKEAIFKYEILQQLISKLRLIGLKVQFYNDLQYTTSINTRLFHSYLEGYPVVDN